MLISLVKKKKKTWRSTTQTIYFDCTYSYMHESDDGILSSHFFLGLFCLMYIGWKTKEKAFYFSMFHYLTSLHVVLNALYRQVKLSSLL
ncbi:uncharacterized protein B0P05DRAFT_559489 [Gilbertella persicaria]|uniref:uncharacterized protein n=1 Tax=Gilbertella persicaria TaxID=101096 RepID=UPI00221EC7DD|nr:uncharacterized protein B0P05DRAFT_559489 [Gilbertella persicaria]KAI8058698.1 hypothetical protein B0P05DRAFT_559489 [Gilbertella persicaria]